MVLALDLGDRRAISDVGTGSGAEEESSFLLSGPATREIGMRQLWRRASRLRLFLVLAAIAVITLAASSPIYSAVRGSHIADDNVASPVATAGGCSKATASKVMTRYGIGVIKPVQPKTPIGRVLCGPFLGPGSRGMVASVAIPSCGGSVAWAVFRYTGGTWRLVMKQNHGAFLAAVGSDIREEIGVLAPGDAHCFPSSVKYRFWHWNGSRLRAGPWARALSYDSILSPDRQIWCKFAVYPTREVVCAERNPVHTAQLRTSGVFTVCNGSNCLQNWDTSAHVLKYGQADEWGAFSCLAEQKGITCTVIGGKAARKGFLINASGVIPVSP
jgi:hypothetical protein